MSRARRIFEQHHLPVFRWLLRMTGRRGLAEELTQEVFLRAIRALPGYRDRGRERAWLFRIARNLLLNEKRDASRASVPESLDAMVLPPAAEPAPERRLELARALAGLPGEEREAFLLRELGGLGYEEISAVCDTTRDAVRSRIYRARRGLRERLVTAAPKESRRGPRENDP